MNGVTENQPRQQLDMNVSEKLQHYMKILQFFDDDIDDYLYIYDLAAQRVYFTNKIRKRFPLPLAEDNGVDFEEWEKIVYYKDRQFMDYKRNQLISGEIKSFNITYRIFDVQGNKVWINAKGAMRTSEDSDSSLLVGRVSEMVMGRLVDSLTGLCSVEKFMEDLNECKKSGNGYLMILGADNFKHINVTQGRTAGDDVLRHIAEILEQQVEYPANIYRLDGDCFAVIMPNQQQPEIAQFYHAVKEKIKGNYTISAGAVAYRADDKVDSSATYQYAESALDQAKKDGKNKLVFFSRNDFQRDLERIELLEEMQSSIAQDGKGFWLCYQPKINSRTFELDGVEVLLRYQSPSKGSMSPMEFIPLLERSGLICSVGEWVLRTALLQCKKWRETIPNLRISVNLSQVQLEQKGIEDTVLNIVKEVGIPGDALMLEVTESIQLQDYITLNRIFYLWKQHGIQISIDDFGTGYSSLSYLKRIEINEVKIDKCFVDHVQCNAYNYRLLRNMIELAHSAQIKVCCEGVETYEEFLALQELNTDRYQGYLFAKPYTKEAFERAFLCTDTAEYQERKLKQLRFQQERPGEHKEFLENLRKEELGNITECMEECVYVSDVESHELYYLNEAGRRITGVYDYKGCKCYQVLKGRNSPCTDCNNSQLQESKFCVWENENTYLKKNYILKDKLIRWQGRLARLEIAIDVTEREVVSKAIQKKLDFEKAIVDACRSLASESTPETIAHQVVRIIGEFCQGKRAYILKVNQDSKVCELRSEWCAEGQQSIQEYFPVQVQELQEESTEQRISARIMRENKLVGLVGVDYPAYKKDAYNLLQTMAYFLGYNMTGEENQRKLNHLLESRYDDIRNHTDLGLWEIRLNLESGECELYPDKVLCRIMDMPENLPPKDSYQFWYSRIHPDYYEYIHQSVQEIIHTGDVIHVQYPWRLDSKGEVLVKCVGIRREDCDGMICMEGYHWVITK